VKQFRVSGSKQAVDQATKGTVGSRYELQDEIKLLRRAVMALSEEKPLPEEFVQYNDFVERVVSERGKLKRG
jgi:hypothetical protein